MVVIYDINSNYNENEISLGNPGKIHGSSNYYTKIFINKELFYFKINNCTTKNGILQTEKKIYTDIMFSLLNNDIYYVEWFHHLESILIDLIYSKSSSWFLSELDKEDINEYFNPVLRQYKRNNNLLRLQLNNKKNIPECIIFDENEEVKSYDDVAGKNFDCIIHIKGIRFTSTSFQIDLELKQILLLEETNLFSSCILRNNSNKSENCININSCNDDNNYNNENKNDTLQINQAINETINEPTNELDELNEYSKNDSSILLLSNGEEYIEENSNIENNYQNVSNEFENANSDENEKSDKNANSDEKIKEYSINCNMDKLNSVEIREPTEVYKELYEKMLQKAITAKQEYLNAYKQAQFIKQEYLGIYDNDEKTDQSNDLQL